MSSNYYDMRDGKVRIARELMNRGWKVYGFHEDESDSMTDYYSPAYWNGIAEKNGFVLCIDISSASEIQEIKKYNYSGCLSHADKEKIEKLQAMTQERGATAGEEENAKALIEKIKANTSDFPTYEVIGYIPAHQANPSKSKWHIEKDGIIYDKGTGITKYSDMPREIEFDIIKMEYTDSYKKVWTSDDENGQRVYTDRQLTDEQKKLINDFKSLILKWERIVNNMNTMGDGTKETEQAAEQQREDDKLEKVTEKITKKVIKPIQKDNTEINLNDVLSFRYHGGYWQVTEIYNNNKGQKCIVYELLGSEKRGYQRLNGNCRKSYYQLESRLLKELEKGDTKIYTLQEVEEVQEVEKWVRKKSTNKKSTITENKPEQQDTKKEEIKEQTQEKESTLIPYNFTITADTDTRDNSPLWVVKITDKLSRDEYLKVEKQFKTINGYYSRFKSGFIFKYDPTKVLSNDSKLEEKQEQEQQEVQEQIQQEENINNSEPLPEQVTKRQLWTLQSITQLNLKDLKITKEQASDLISRSLKGENITDIIKEMLNNKAA